MQNRVSTERLVVTPPSLPIGGPSNGVKRLARVMFISVTAGELPQWLTKREVGLCQSAVNRHWAEQVGSSTVPANIAQFDISI